MNPHPFRTRRRTGTGSPRIDVEDCIDLEEWRHIADLCSYATFFHTPDWYRLFARSDPGMQIRTQKIIFSDGKKAILPLMKIRAGRLRSLYLSGPAGVYGGWVSGDDLNEGRLNLILSHIRTKIPNLIWRINPFAPGIQALPVHPSQEDFTQVIDLGAGFEPILKRWTKGHRAAVNQALHFGVCVGPASTLDEWREYFACYQDSIRRWGAGVTSRYEWPFFENMFAMNSEKIKLWLAKKESRVVAGALCLSHNRHMVYWHGASREDFLHLRAAQLLQHVIIRDAVRKGYRWYDFNPSGGHEGVVKFKKGFGALPLESGIVRQSKRGLLRRTSRKTSDGD